MLTCPLVDHPSNARSERLDLTLLVTAHLTTPCGDTFLPQIPEIATVAEDATPEPGCGRLGDSRG